MSAVIHFASSVAYDALVAYMLVWLVLFLLLLLDEEIASTRALSSSPNATSNISLLSKYQVQNLPNHSQYHSGAELFFHLSSSTKKVEKNIWIRYE